MIMHASYGNYTIGLTSLNFFSREVAEFFPLMDSLMIDLARDFELPGFPTRKRGILNSTQMAIMNTFSRRAAFLAMLSARSMLSSNAS